MNFAISGSCITCNLVAANALYIVAPNALYTCRCGPWPRARPKLCTISSVRRDCTAAGPASVRVSRTQKDRHPTAASVTDRPETGPDCPHEQLRFEVDVTEKEAEKKD